MLGTVLAKFHQPKCVNKNLVLGLLACYIQQKKMQIMRHQEDSQNGEVGGGQLPGLAIGWHA